MLECGSWPPEKVSVVKVDETAEKRQGATKHKQKYAEGGTEKKPSNTPRAQSNRNCLPLRRERIGLLIKALLDQSTY